MSEELRLVPAAGTACEEFTPRALFYLTHRQQIEEWHGLVRDARTATQAFLETLSDPLAAVADEFGLEVRRLDAGAGRYFFLVPPDSLATAAVPLVAANFGWNASKVVTLDDKGWAPFVSIRVDRGQPGWNEARERLLEHGRKRRDENGYRHDTEWPIWRNVRGEANWWASLDDYRAMVGEEVRELLRLFGEDLRRAASTAPERRKSP